MSNSMGAVVIPDVGAVFFGLSRHSASPALSKPEWASFSRATGASAACRHPRAATTRPSLETAGRSQPTPVG